MRQTEYVFRPRIPVWIWFTVSGFLGLYITAGFFLAWVAALPAIGSVFYLALVGAFAASTRVLLERDDHGGGHITVIRRKNQRESVALSRLASVSFKGGGFELNDESGARVATLLDDRLRREVALAAAHRRLELDDRTARALTNGGSTGRAQLRLLVPLVPIAFLPLVIFAGTGISIHHPKAVGATTAREIGREVNASVNPFWGTAPRELYLVPIDAESRRRLPRVAALLANRFHMRAEVVGAFLLDGRMVAVDRRQIDGWQVVIPMLNAHQEVHPGRAGIVIAVTGLDMFDSRFASDRFAYIAWTAGGPHTELCGGVISTARLHVRPGSVGSRLDKLAARLLGRCIGIAPDRSLRSIRDLDRLDDHAGVDARTISRYVAARRALQPAASGRVRAP